MRDPKRIERIMNLVEEIWKLNPDMRLGQLLENYAFGHHSSGRCCIFHIEDNEVEQNLKETLKTLKK